MVEFPVYAEGYKENLLLPVSVDLSTAYTVYTSLVQMATVQNTISSVVTPNLLGNIQSLTILSYPSNVSFTVALVFANYLQGNVYYTTVYLPSSVLPPGTIIRERLYDVGILTSQAYSGDSIFIALGFLI